MADFARGQRLVELRGRRSQEDAAHEIGVTAKSLRAWEKGGSIRWENAKKVAAYYKVDPEELVSREFEPDRVDELEQDIAEIKGSVAEILKRLERLDATRAGRAASGGRKANQSKRSGSPRTSAARKRKQAGG